MKASATGIADVLLIEPRVFADSRGFFFESYNERAFAEVGIEGPFVQDNQSFSYRDVVRGLHYQVQQAQGKLIRCVNGEIFDVAVDIRRFSPTFGKWVGEVLSSNNKRMLWVPAGFAHGFRVLSESAEVLYKATDFYAPQHERTILWDDAAIQIEWPGAGQAILSDKDLAGSALRQAEVYESPVQGKRHLSAASNRKEFSQQGSLVPEGR
jgi:dTDP-4-dehydrorhamnose 3,5-epimerase